MNMFETVRAIIGENATNNPEEILSCQGVKIFRFPMKGIRGIYKALHGIPMVFVDAELDEHEQKFVLAHELAHHLFHRGVNRVFLDRCTYMKTDCFEREAELFAMCLLYPCPDDILYEGENADELSTCVGVRREVAEMYLREALKH